MSDAADKGKVISDLGGLGEVARELAAPIYRDVLQPSAQVVGTNLARVARFNVLRSDGSVSFVVESDAMITEDKLPKGLVR